MLLTLKNIAQSIGAEFHAAKNNTNKIIRKWASKSYYPTFFENANVPPHPTVFLRNNVYKIAGLFNTNYIFASDYDFLLRIFKKYHFKSYYLNKVTIRMRLGGLTNNSFKNIFIGNLEIIKSWKENKINIGVNEFCRIAEGNMNEYFRKSESSSLYYDLRQYGKNYKI